MVVGEQEGEGKTPGGRGGEEKPEVAPGRRVVHARREVRPGRRRWYKGL